MTEWALRFRTGDFVKIRGFDDQWWRVVGMEVFHNPGGTLAGEGFELMIDLQSESGRSECRTVWYFVTETRRAVIA